MKIRTLTGIALAATTLLALTGCGAAATPETPAAPGGGGDSEYYIDPATEQISEEAAARITELYEAAIADGETELNIISGLPDDMAPTFEAFEAMFPEIKINITSLIGAPLVTQLQSEKQSGNQVTDILHNPNGQQYVDFAQEYEVVGMTVPDALAEGAEELIDPEHKYTSPFIGFFGLGIFLPRAQQTGLEPTQWSDFADPEYTGLIGMGDPNIPGPSQDAPIYLMQNGAFEEGDVEGLAENVVIKGTYGDAVAGLMQGEYAFMFAAPSSAIKTASEAGAPVEFRLMESDNYVVTHKHLLLDGAPNPSAGKLYLEFLNTFTAQQAVASKGLTPLNLKAAEATVAGMPWTSWEEANLSGIVPAGVIDEERPGLIDWFKTIFRA